MFFLLSYVMFRCVVLYSFVWFVCLFFCVSQLVCLLACLLLVCALFELFGPWFACWFGNIRLCCLGREPVDLLALQYFCLFFGMFCMKRVLCSMQDGLTGSAWGDWANYTASPLRAFENELGVQAPVGFWDPAGFAADGSTENFARRRQTELKHGRISMLAA